MNRVELIAARRTLGLNKTQMAATLRTPYRTYQEWENGGRRIPGITQVAMELLQQKDRWVMAAIKAKIERRLEL